MSIDLDKLCTKNGCGCNLGIGDAYQQAVIALLCSLRAASGNLVEPTEWISESTANEDLTGGPLQLVGSPGPGFRIVVRYLSYNNASDVNGILQFLHGIAPGGTSIFPNHTTKNSIFATRFNKNDYLYLPEDEALSLSSDGDLIDSACATWEYAIVPV